jgi:O-acetyl-ADP-ribose deacetylase (regulator of RNase III)
MNKTIMDHTLGSIAFPAISTGIFGFPKPEAAQAILSTIHNFLVHHSPSNLKLIHLVLYDQETLQAFLKVWEQDDQFHP